VSRDDPFVALVPVAECLANPNIALVETSRGGHVAHLQGGTQHDTLQSLFPTMIRRVFDGLARQNIRSLLPQLSHT